MKNSRTRYCFMNPGQALGARLLADWEETLEVLVKYPLSFQKVRGDYRQVSLNKFPYMIIYYVEGRSVYIFRFIYSRRNTERRYKK